MSRREMSYWEKSSRKARIMGTVGAISGLIGAIAGVHALLTGGFLFTVVVGLLCWPLALINLGFVIHYSGVIRGEVMTRRMSDALDRLRGVDGDG